MNSKDISEITKNFIEITNRFTRPSPIDEAINEAYRELIKKIVDTNPPTQELFDFLNGFEQMVKQEKRKKDIVKKAKQFLEYSAKPQNISDDWFEFFFEKAKLVSNEEMKLIWSKVLAEEANYPGKITPSLLHALSIMTYEQAQFFCNISLFALREYKRDDVNLLIFLSANRKAYLDFNITPRTLKEIERLGLVDCDFNKEYIFENKIKFIAGNNLLTVYGDPNNGNKIQSGNVEFTNDGKALYDIIDNTNKRYRTDILDFTITKLKARNCTVFLNHQKI